MNDLKYSLGRMRPWVRAQIANGRFASESEAVQVALANLAAHDARIADLKSLVQEGLDDVAAGRMHDYEDAQSMVDDVLNGPA